MQQAKGTTDYLAIQDIEPSQRASCCASAPVQGVERNGAGADCADIQIDIYVAAHCAICAYSYEIADFIREHFPTVAVRIINIEATSDPIPEVVFATPTYVLNGRVWSLGNPSPAQVREKLHSLGEEAIR